MGLGHSPRIVTDGLVLALDAGNPKNYNVGISTNWTDKVGGNNGTLVGGTNHTDGPFVGAGYVEFDGSGDYLTLASSSDWDLGSGDFTIEFWAYFNDVTTAQKTLITRRNALSNYAPYYLGCDTSSRITFFASSNGSSYDVANNLTFGSLTTNRWYHIALVRNGSQFTGYIDGTGTSLLTSSATLYNNSQSLVVGAETDPTLEHDGFISNLRIVKGTALYTAAFTPPTKPLTAVTNTVLLTCQGNTIADASSGGHTLTANGNAAANLGYPASAFEFDGSNDYVTIPDSDDFDIGPQNTMECWVKINTIGTNKLFFGKLNTWWFAMGYSAIGVSANRLGISFNDGSAWNGIQNTYNISIGTWYHLVATWDGTNIRLYVNGVLESTSSDLSSKTWNTSSGTLDIGAYSGTASTSTDCAISNARVYHDKVLTASEVQQNYNALKGRYV